MFQTRVTCPFSYLNEEKLRCRPPLAISIPCVNCTTGRISFSFSPTQNASVQFENYSPDEFLLASMWQSSYGWIPKGPFIKFVCSSCNPVPLRARKYALNSEIVPCFPMKYISRRNSWTGKAFQNPVHSLNMENIFARYAFCY